MLFYHRIDEEKLVVQRQASGMHLEPISLFLCIEVGQTAVGGLELAQPSQPSSHHSCQPHVTPTTIESHANTGNLLFAYIEVSISTRESSAIEVSVRHAADMLASRKRSHRADVCFSMTQSSNKTNTNKSHLNLEVW